MSTLISDRDFSGVAGAVTTGILRGANMREWWNSFPTLTLLDLPGSCAAERMQYFFSTLPIDDKPTSVMGCLQTSTFARRASPGQPAVSLAAWVSANFLQKCRWTGPEGARHGFLYRPVLVLDNGDGSAVRRVDEDIDLKLSDVGSSYHWAVARLDILGYMRAFPVVGRYYRHLSVFNREAGYMVLNPDFFESPHPLPPGCVEHYAFAYTVAPWTVMPTIAAYGPGRFHSAFKQFRFYLMEDGTVAIEVLFIVAPRCERVLSIGGIDPVFGTVELLDTLTLRRTRIRDRAYNGVNHYAMGHHARVHRDVLAGMRHIWEETNWQPAPTPAPVSLQFS